MKIEILEIGNMDSLLTEGFINDGWCQPVASAGKSSSYIVKVLLGSTK